MPRRLVFDNSVVPDVLALHVSKHAMDAYELFYPLRHLADTPERAGRVLDAIANGVSIPLGEALRLVGRSVDRPDADQSTYVLHQERTGIFVIARNRNREAGEPVVVTFLRFVSYLQHTMACSMYGEGAEPSGSSVPWRDRCIAERQAPEVVRQSMGSGLVLMVGVSTEPDRTTSPKVIIAKHARKAVGPSVDAIAADMISSGDSYKVVDGKLLQLYRSDGEYRVSLASLSVSASKGINSRLSSGQTRTLALEMFARGETTRIVEGLGAVRLVSTPGACRLTMDDSDASTHAENESGLNAIKQTFEGQVCPAGVPWGELRVSSSLTESGPNRFWRFRKLLSEQTWERFWPMDTPQHLRDPGAARTDELVFRIVLPDNRVVWVVHRLIGWCAVPRLPVDVPEHLDMARKLIAAGWTCRPPDVVDEAEGDPEAT